MHSTARLCNSVCRERNFLLGHLFGQGIFSGRPRHRLKNTSVRSDCGCCVSIVAFCKLSGALVAEICVAVTLEYRQVDDSRMRFSSITCGSFLGMRIFAFRLLLGRSSTKRAETCAGVAPFADCPDALILRRPLSSALWCAERWLFEIVFHITNRTSQIAKSGPAKRAPAASNRS